ncbi:hypothetical protein X801_03330, partial [Opisthorchis viverrini]
WDNIDHENVAKAYNRAVSDAAGARSTKDDVVHERQYCARVYGKRGHCLVNKLMIKKSAEEEKNNIDYKASSKYHQNIYYILRPNLFSVVTPAGDPAKHKITLKSKKKHPQLVAEDIFEMAYKTKNSSVEDFIYLDRCVTLEDGTSKGVLDFQIPRVSKIQYQGSNLNDILDSARKVGNEELGCIAKEHVREQRSVFKNTRKCYIKLGRDDEPKTIAAGKYTSALPAFEGDNAVALEQAKNNARLLQFVQIAVTSEAVDSSERTVGNVIVGTPKPFAQIDGTLITGLTTEGHLKSLKLIFDRLRACGV